VHIIREDVLEKLLPVWLLVRTNLFIPNLRFARDLWRFTNVL